MVPGQPVTDKEAHRRSVGLRKTTLRTGMTTREVDGRQDPAPLTAYSAS